MLLNDIENYTSKFILIIYFCLFTVIMPFKCCVPGCKGNYENGPKVSVFKFPVNETVSLAWQRAICRADFKPSKTSKVGYV